MGTKDDKYLVLRGKNKDIYFIQKRVSKKISSIIGKDFIKKSLETNDILIARQKRDDILKELEEIESKHVHKNVPTKIQEYETHDSQQERQEAGVLMEKSNFSNQTIENQDFSSKIIQAANNIGLNSQNIDSHGYKNQGVSAKKDLNNQNVPINNTLDLEVELNNPKLSSGNGPDDSTVSIEKASAKGLDSSEGYFSFIDYSKLPKKEDILAWIDKITPLAILFLAFFVFFSV